MQGNCSGIPVDTNALQLAGAPLRPLSEGQCVIVADRSVLQTEHGRLWVDNVYIRLTRSPPESVSVLVSVTEDAQLWMTRSTLQGNGRFDAEQGAIGIFSDRFGHVFAQGTPPA